MWIRQVLLYKSAKPRPRHLVFLAASAQLLEPRAANFIPETNKPSQVVRYRMIIEVAAHDLCQPCANLAYRFVSLQFQLFPDCRKRRSQPFLDRQSQYLETPCRVFEQQCVKPRKSKVSGLPSPCFLHRCSA